MFRYVCVASVIVNHPMLLLYAEDGCCTNLLYVVITISLHSAQHQNKTCSLNFLNFFLFLLRSDLLKVEHCVNVTYVDKISA